MTPDKYNRVKEIFLTACEKPREQQSEYVSTACNGDAELQREVESLLKEHGRDTQVMPSEPEGPLGSMSAILSRAHIDLGPDVHHPSAMRGEAGDHQARGRPHDQTHYLDDSSTSGQDTRSGIVDAGRFMAGTVAAGRYRIIEMLGRGGMGEVYRADDLMLNQSVALKFLPALFGQDQKWLERFRNEVRLARQVTHPNVCRVFDIGEFQGEQFISMEYIDGENLASLLRRIGRVPDDKALQIARQLCAGLSAAHDRGVLHRDLKPANVMIDGRGSVRITDFGLAAPVDQLRHDGVRAGTPAYMSPEQLAGKPVTVRSDVYSLGLILYEMFTGRRAFRADSLREYQKLHSSEDPTPPSAILDDIDPIVERVIMRCLEKDPKHRPASAMAVSAALPGGNPLREILAAGETPSPEVVAAAGEAHGAMKPRLAAVLMTVGLLCMILFVSMAPSLYVVQRAIQEKAPAVLTDRAQTLLKTLGYPEKPRDTEAAFAANAAYYVRVENSVQKSRLWMLTRTRPGLVYFWYRQSPELLVPQRPDGVVMERDPAQLSPGMVTVRLDPKGRLIGLNCEPSDEVTQVPVSETGPAPPPPPPGTTSAQIASAGDLNADWWTVLRDAADMDMSRFTRVEPQGAPLVYCDKRLAFQGTFEDAPNEPVRIEAGAYRNRAVYFAVVGPWREELLSEEQATVLSLGRSNVYVQSAIVSLLLAAGSFLAWRNYRSGRGDRQGAHRMALAFFILGFVVWLFRAHHVPNLLFEFLLFQRGMGAVLYLVALVWIFYMALEPYVRRIWPETVISWTRLLSGRWMDPLVGRDVLAGSAVGAISLLLSIGEYKVPAWMGFTIPLPSIVSATLMLSSTRSWASLFNNAITSLYLGLLMLLFLVLVRMVTRRRWVAGIAFVILFAAATGHFRLVIPWWHLGAENLLSFGVQSLLAILILALLMRHGLVAVIFCMLVRAMLIDFPVTWNFSAWYANASMASILSVVAMLGAGFYAAMGGRGLWPVRDGVSRRGA